jgi:hypothetical protein
MRIVFLLGSGTSLDAGMPSVDAITEQVVSGDGAFLHTSNVFLIDRDNPNYELLRPSVLPVLKLIEDLRALSVDYFGREPNYEEISQLARQVDDALSGEYETAAVMPLAKQLVSSDYVEGDYSRLIELSQLAHRYVADTVRQMLDCPPVRLDHLAVIVEACKRLSRVDLATLNHDLVLENALDGAAIFYGDGFEQIDEDVRFWVDNWGQASVRLMKLHGSLDWWGHEVPDEQWRGWVTARYCGDDPIHPKRLGVTLEYPQDLRPILLTGTFDKILAYETWIFPDQHLRFQEALRETSRVVVIGYGFGDKAINTRLISWLARARENKLIVCHGRPDELREHARGAIQGKWARWQADGQLSVVRAWIAELNYIDIAARLP